MMLMDFLRYPGVFKKSVRGKMCLFYRYLKHCPRENFLKKVPHTISQILRVTEIQLLITLKFSNFYFLIWEPKIFEYLGEKDPRINVALL